MSRLLDEQPAAHGAKIEGHLPLHWAVKHRAPQVVVETLLASRPDSPKVKTRADHILPAQPPPAYRDRPEPHGASFHGRSVLETSIKTRTAGNLPLHLVSFASPSSAPVRTSL